MPRRIAFLIYPGFQLLDAAGPIAAFEIAGRMPPGAYELEVIAASGRRRCAAAPARSCWRAACRRAAGIDTLIVCGGDGARAATRLRAHPALHPRLRAARASAWRACAPGPSCWPRAGLLDGARGHHPLELQRESSARASRACTWMPDRIFVRAGRYWSSAGITAGIDLSLALIGEDLGSRSRGAPRSTWWSTTAAPAASRSSPPCWRCAARRAGSRALFEFMRAHLGRRLTVERPGRARVHEPAALRARLPRETGVTPAKAVERLRADAARAILESGTRSVQQVARGHRLQRPGAHAARVRAPVRRGPVGAAPRTHAGQRLTA